MADEVANVSVTADTSQAVSEFKKLGSAAQATTSRFGDLGKEGAKAEAQLSKTEKQSKAFAETTKSTGRELAQTTRSTKDWIFFLGKLAGVAAIGVAALKGLEAVGKSWREELNAVIAAQRDQASVMTSEQLEALRKYNREMLSNEKRAQSVAEVHGALAQSTRGFGDALRDVITPFSDLERMNTVAFWQQQKREILLTADAATLLHASLERLRAQNFLAANDRNIEASTLAQLNAGRIGAAQDALVDANEMVLRKRRENARKPGKDTRAFKQFASMDTAGLMMGRGDGRDAGAIDPFSKEAQAAELEATRAFEAQRSELVLGERMRSIEAQRAAGVDPISLIEAEEQAQLTHLEFMETQAQSELERNAIIDQQREVTHRANLARLEEERKAQARRISMLEGVVDITHAVGKAALMAAIVQKSSAKEAVKGVATGVAIEMGLLGAVELVRAAIAAWTYRPVEAAAHIANSAAAFAQAGVAGAIAGAASIGGGRSVGVPGGITGSMFGGGGGGGGAGFGGGPAANQGPAPNDSEIPGSPASPSAPRSPSSRSAAGGKVVQFNGPVHLYGTPPKDFLRSVDSGLEELSHEQRTFAGGQKTGSG